MSDPKTPESDAKLASPASETPASGTPGAVMSDGELDAVSGGGINFSDQFTGLPMGDLIGGPLGAASDAQVRVANATASFLKQVGIKP